VDANALVAEIVFDDHLVARLGAKHVLAEVARIDRARILGVGRRAYDDGAVGVAVDEPQQDLGPRAQREVHAVACAGMGLRHAKGMGGLPIGAPGSVEGHLHVVSTRLVELGVVALDLPIHAGVDESANARPRCHAAWTIRRGDGNRLESCFPVLLSIVLTTPMHQRGDHELHRSELHVVEHQPLAHLEVHGTAATGDHLRARHQCLLAKRRQPTRFGGILAVGAVLYPTTQCAARGAGGLLKQRQSGRPVVVVVHRHRLRPPLHAGGDAVGGGMVGANAHRNGRSPLVGAQCVRHVGEYPAVVVGRVPEAGDDPQVFTEALHEGQVGLFVLNGQLPPRVRVRERESIVLVLFQSNRLELLGDDLGSGVDE